MVPARINLYKKTGGKVEILFLVNEWGGGDTSFKVMADRKIEVGDELSIGEKFRKDFLVEKQESHFFWLRPNFEANKIFEILEEFGMTPIPKYIKGTDISEKELREKYQSIFAKNPSSVAAPTASLHFTSDLLAKLNNAGFDRTFVTLNVGLGTFAPLTDENFKKESLHSESFMIKDDAVESIRDAKSNRNPVVAVGTTVARTLESAASHILEMKWPISGSTNIFIHPPFNFKVVDCLVTNFHLPNSSLMMMVEAFLENKKSPLHLVELYKKAIKERFRFYSFGDGMLIK